MAEEKIKVTAYAGSRGSEKPMSFVLRNDRIEVIQIQERWIEERLESRSRRRFFKVRGSDGYTHKIFYDETIKEWFVVV
jgi:hypothetical protein